MTRCDGCWKALPTDVYIDPDYQREYHFCKSCAYEGGLITEAEWKLHIEAIMAKYN